MEILNDIFMGAVTAMQWIFEGFVASISDSRYWGGLIVALGVGWMLGRVLPRRKPCEEAVDPGDDDWEDEDWEEEDEDVVAWWVSIGFGS